tara:strand:- start:170 stop:967 length:798 start_codon:yes stop_codon:yes gene_type:complete
MSIVVYSPDFFLNTKDQIKSDDIDEILKNEIKKLISNHSCFKKYKNFNNNYKKKEFYKKFVPKTDDKIILGYLNKITEDNYETLSKKIIINTTSSNYSIIIDKLNLISFKQSNYSDLYMKLYKCIIINEVRKNYLTNKIDEIVTNKKGDLKLIVTNTSSNSYDEFCDINKEKKNLKGKIKIILYLIKNNIIPFTKDYIFKNILKYKDYENDIYLEILQIIHNIIYLEENQIEDLNNYLKTNNFKGKMMYKFKIKDIIDNIKMKDF